MTAPTPLTTDELRALRRWLPHVYLSGPAKDLAPALQEIETLLTRLDQMMAVSMNHPEKR